MSKYKLNYIPVNLSSVKQMYKSDSRATLQWTHFDTINI